MTEVWFYHLERTGLDQALPELLEKTLARGWRARVRCASRDRLEHLDGWLWSYRDDSFLPHGTATDPAMAPRHPVLLTLDEGDPNGAQVLFLIDGAEPGPLDGVERCVLLFDGRDEAAVAAARIGWKAFAADGHAVTYWRQSEAGAWRKQG